MITIFFSQKVPIFMIFCGQTHNFFQPRLGPKSPNYPHWRIPKLKKSCLIRTSRSGLLCIPMFIDRISLNLILWWSGLGWMLKMYFHLRFLPKSDSERSEPQISHPPRIFLNRVPLPFPFMLNKWLSMHTKVLNKVEEQTRASRAMKEEKARIRAHLQSSVASV